MDPPNVYRTAKERKLTKPSMQPAEITLCLVQ